MRPMALLLASVCLSGCGWFDCPDEGETPIESGLYEASDHHSGFGGAAWGEPGSPYTDDGFPHPGYPEQMEVDRAAGLVRISGTTPDGKPFVETWRIGRRVE